MRYDEIAKRYAKALYQLATDHKTEAKVFEDLRALQKIIHDVPEALAYFDSPIVEKRGREASLKQAFSSKGLSEEVVSFMLLLAHKNRLGILTQIIEAFQNEIDSANGVTRGTVESAITLSPEERKILESTVRKVTKKEVILTYKTNPKVIGGMVARVGGYTFDDTIQSHLIRMNDDLKRRVN
jgi:F-type H+-transporting ATPase subunit delta